MLGELPGAIGPLCVKVGKGFKRPVRATILGGKCERKKHNLPIF